MTDQLPADVRAVLSQVLAEARESLSAGDAGTAESLVDTARTVTENKVPPGECREELLEGCRRVESVLAGESNPDERCALAAAYCRRLRRVVEEG